MWFSNVNVFEKGEKTAGSVLKERFDIPLVSMGIPMGVKATDRFFSALEEITAKSVPEKYKRVSKMACIIDKN